MSKCKTDEDTQHALEALRAALPDWSWYEHGNAPGVILGHKDAHWTAGAKRGGEVWWATVEYREVSTAPGKVHVARKASAVEAVSAALALHEEVV